MLDQDNYFEVAESLYCYCEDYHEGQNSIKYSIMSSQLDYSPGMGGRSEDAEMFYDEFKALTDTELESLVIEIHSYCGNC